jgi:hypothetical protein
VPITTILSPTLGREVVIRRVWMLSTGRIADRMTTSFSASDAAMPRISIVAPLFVLICRDARPSTTW